MSYHLVRVLTCDCDGCDTPAPYVLQGEDDQASKDGWYEQELEGVKVHTCPQCMTLGRSPTKKRETVLQS